MQQTDLKRELIEFGIIVVMLLGLVVVFNAFGVEVKTLPYLIPYGCHWQECQLIPKKESIDINRDLHCGEMKYGSSVQLSDLLESKGEHIVRYECGPGEGERK